MHVWYYHYYLYFFVFIDAPIITIEGPDIIREGDNVSLHCNITSALPVNNISWYFITNSSTEAIILQLQEPVLMIVNARQDSSGFYICSVTDDVRTTNQSKEIHIQCKLQ